MSKASDIMKRYPGVGRRTGSTVWQWSLKVPDDLRKHYPTQWAQRCSLKTSDLREANEQASKLHTQWQDVFAQQRRALNPQRIEHVSPELSKALAARVASALMRSDDAVRGSPEAARLLLDTLRPFRAASKLTIGKVAPSPSPAPDTAPEGPQDPPSWLDGLSVEVWEELADLNAGTNENAAMQMAMQRVSAVLPFVKTEARALGLEFDEKAPGALDALRESLKAYRMAIQDIARRDHGEVIETPAVDSRPAAAAKSKPVKLRDVLPQWKASKARKPQTEKAAEKALALYEQATGNPPIDTLTRSQGVDMRAFLLAGGVSAKTASDRFDYIKGFLNFASRELVLLPRNPWEGLLIKSTTTTPRRPWSSEQLGAYFSRPLHAAYDLPTSWEAGADAAYWVPLLGAFTGARISELCQLRTADFSVVDGVNVLRVTDEGEGQTVKTAAGRRVVPIHPELVRLGLLEFVAAIRTAGSVQLFPALPLHKTKPGQYFSEWFATTRGLPDGSKLPDFHSLRHTVRSKLASAGIAEPLIDTLIGHEVRGSTGARSYTLRTTEDLRRALETLTFPGLTLPRVFVNPKALVPKRKRTGGPARA